MSSATVEERARKKAERKLEKQRQAAQHDLPRSMRPSAAVKTLTVVLLVLVLIYFLFPIYWAIIASTKTPAQMTGSNGMWFAVPLDQLPNAIATNYSKLLGWTRGNFWRWVLNSLIYSGVSALIGTIVSVMAGYATAKFNFRGKNATIRHPSCLHRVGDQYDSLFRTATTQRHCRRMHMMTIGYQFQPGALVR